MMPLDLTIRFGVTCGDHAEMEIMFAPGDELQAMAENKAEEYRRTGPHYKKYNELQKMVDYVNIEVQRLSKLYDVSRSDIWERIDPEGRLQIGDDVDG